MRKHNDGPRQIVKIRNVFQHALPLAPGRDTSGTQKHLSFTGHEFHAIASGHAITSLAQSFGEMSFMCLSDHDDLSQWQINLKPLLKKKKSLLLFPKPLSQATLWRF